MSTDIGYVCDNELDELELRKAKARLEHLVYSIRDMIVRETGVDLTQFGVEHYMHGRHAPWPKGDEAHKAYQWWR